MQQDCFSIEYFKNTSSAQLWATAMSPSGNQRTLIIMSPCTDCLTTVYMPMHYTNYYLICSYLNTIFKKCLKNIFILGKSN